MQILSRDTLPLGGFNGLTEHRLVTDSRAFGRYKNPHAWEGLGQFVYLADARFQPKGETGMHGHKEIDVISVMVDGDIAHAGSLEHGQQLKAGDVQVQRAGGEGFSHNEVNPNEQQNRMIQLWALPQSPGQPAGYKVYTPSSEGLTRIYGGSKGQEHTFDSPTLIDIARHHSGQQHHQAGESLIYVTRGTLDIEGTQVKDGDLIRGQDLTIQALTNSEYILIRPMDN